MLLFRFMQFYINKMATRRRAENLVFLITLSWISLCHSAGKLYIEDHPDLVITLPGKSVMLECEVVTGASSSPSIYWTLNGEKLDQTYFEHDGRDLEGEYGQHLQKEDSLNDLRLGTLMSRLYIDCPSQQDEGQYSCVASADEEHVTSNTTLRLAWSRHSKHSRCNKKRMTHRDKRIPARILTWSVNRLEYNGSSVMLTCRGEGSPKPSVTWFDPHDVLVEKNSYQYKTLESGDLLVKDIRWPENMGLYRCVVENRFGKDEVSTFLYPVLSMGSNELSGTRIK